MGVLRISSGSADLRRTQRAHAPARPGCDTGRGCTKGEHTRGEISTDPHTLGMLSFSVTYS